MAELLVYCNKLLCDRGYQLWKAIKIIYRNRYGLEKTNDEVFVENSNYARHNIKKRILRDKMIAYFCAICGIEAIWHGKPMPLILDHINGINNDNRLCNLRFVCSNCDSQLPTYKSKNIRSR